jgi:DNA-binding XRE family transcriptional regulator
MVSVTKTLEEHEQVGRDLVRYGRLIRLRRKLGLSRTTMAELLSIAPATYIRCESQPLSSDRMWKSTAERLGRFAWLAYRQLDQLEVDGIPVDDLMPMNLVAQEYGVPQEILLQWYRQGQVEGVDLGILGLWFHRDDLAGKATRDHLPRI